MFNLIYSCQNLFVLFIHQIALLYFFKEIISCFICIFNLNSWLMFSFDICWSNYLFLNSWLLFSLDIFSIKPRIFNISTDSTSLNVYSSSFLRLLLIIERTVFPKIFILGFLNFLYSPPNNAIEVFHFGILFIENILLLFYHSFHIR